MRGQDTTAQNIIESYMKAADKNRAAYQKVLKLPPPKSALKVFKEPPATLKLTRYLGNG